MRLLIFILIGIVFYSCRSFKEAQKSKNRPDCLSVVEASFTADTTFTVKPPLLMLKYAEYSNDTRRLFGSIISINDTGVVFQRSKTPKFYPYERIECLIDSNNQVAYGEWKEDPEVVWDVEFICQRIDTPNAKPFAFVLEANKVSSYCIDPGEYKISKIRFSYSDQYLDEDFSLHSGRFTVAPNAITYIGTIHSEFKRHLGSGVIPIPTIVVNRPSIAIPGGVIFGIAGGVVGALSEQDNIKRERDSACQHGLRVTMDTSCTPTFKGNLPVIHTPLIIEN